MFQTKKNFVKFFPQIQFHNNSQYTVFSRILSEADISSPSFVDVPNLRKQLDYKFWRALAAKDWNQWEHVAHMYAAHSLPMDEVSWTLLVHGYLMSHRHNSANAAAVVGQTALIHPAIVQLNRNLVHSFFHLSDLGVKSSLNAWQNIVKLAWMSAARLRKKRANRIQIQLEAMTAKQVLAITADDVAKAMFNDK